MTGRRMTGTEAERVAGLLSDRDRAILQSLASTRVLTGDQLTRLHFHDLSARTRERVRRRVLGRLTGLRVVTRLGRTVGGVRAGSSGWIYALDVVGQRLAQLETCAGNGSRVRRPWTPSTLFLGHSLAVAELYVRLAELARGAAFAVTTFRTEPACWWPDGLGGFIKPDAFVVLSTERFDELVWAEVDRGSESLPTLRRKLADYLDYMARGQVGPRDVMPLVVVTVPDEPRLAVIQRLVEGLPYPAEALFAVVLHPAAAGFLTDMISEPENRSP